ncbi:MAG: glycosyltransferase family 2 protein [Flavobacteriales bacterium]|nr:glycosyltransferase family 2 protein [Flavobacteriales bacterium]
MKISVITVSYNSGSTIGDTIRSVVSQKYDDVEYLIVDGASKDNTSEIVKSFGSGVTFFLSEKDKGIYDAMNKGVSLAKGEVIGILNSDDFYSDENVLNDVMNLFEETGADALYADLDYVDQLDTSRIVRKWRSGAYRDGLFKWGWMPPHPTFFVKRAVYEKFGAYNLSLKSAADYELMLRLLHKHKVKVAYLPRTIIHMRTGGQSNVTIKNRIKANMEDRIAWKINDLKPGILTLTWKPLRKIKQFFQK